MHKLIHHRNEQSVRKYVANAHFIVLKWQRRTLGFNSTLSASSEWKIFDGAFVARCFKDGTSNES